MKKIFCVICILIINGLYVYSQMKANDAYEFPIKQGTKEWGQFETVEKRIAALQIPSAVLTNISTEGLLETCLAFPYLTDMFFYNNYQKGFEELLAEFNGFQELFKRRDLINVLLEKYQSLSTDVTGVRLLKEVDQGRFTFRDFVLEFMLTQDVVFKNLNSEQKKQLFLVSFENKKVKEIYSDIFGNLNKLPTDLLYVKEALNDPSFKLGSADSKESLSSFIEAPLFLDRL